MALFFFSIFSIDSSDSSDYSEDQYMRCSCMSLAQICSGFTQSEKSETNCNTILAARASTIPREATNSFESSCQIFLSFLRGQENIGLAADALVSWSLWERCLAAVATFRPRVSGSLGESWQSQSEFHQARSRHRPTTFKQPLVSIWHPSNSSRSSSGPDFSIGDRFIDICFSRQ